MTPPVPFPKTSEDLAENRRRMQNGELYYAFTPDLLQERRRCAAACQAYNQASALAPRRDIVELWARLVQDDTPLLPRKDAADDDEAQLADWPWVEAPLRMDYGYNVRLGRGVYVNYQSAWVDTAPITIGARTLVGPNCNFFAGTHPLDPAVRQGTNGPELGRPIVIGDDCWLGGGVTVLPGVTIGDGVVVGAGSVVTKDVPSRVVVAGNPARVIRSTLPTGA